MGRLLLANGEGSDRTPLYILRGPKTGKCTEKSWYQYIFFLGSLAEGSGPPASQVGGLRRPHRLVANPISKLCVKSDEAAVFPEYAFMSTSELPVTLTGFLVRVASAPVQRVCASTGHHSRTRQMTYLETEPTLHGPVA